MILGQQIRAVESLSAQLDETRIQRDIARKTLGSAEEICLHQPGKPAVATQRRRDHRLFNKRPRPKASSQPAASRPPMPISSMISAATALWSGTRAIREELGWSTAELSAKARKAVRSKRVNER